MSNKFPPRLDPSWVVSVPADEGKGFICGWAFTNREQGECTVREISRLFNSAAEFVERFGLDAK